MRTDLPVSFDCQATAAVLRSGGGIALAGHAAALMGLVSMLRPGPAAWLACGSLLIWCAVVYLSLRVNIDARFFELLAQHPSGQLDEWLEATGLRKNVSPRTMADRRRGALRWWRALAIAVALQIALFVSAVFWSLA